MPISIGNVLRKLSRRGVSGSINVGPQGDEVPPVVPRVSIQRVDVDTFPGTCTYQPPVSTECTATSKYEAVLSGFAGDVNLATYLWSFSGGPNTVLLPAPSLTEKTIEITSIDFDTVIIFLEVEVTVEAETAEDQQRVTAHVHSDGNAPPLYIGGAPGSGLEAPELLWHTNEIPIESVDYAPYFSGDNLVFAMLGDPLPTGITLSAAGILSGTVVAGADATTLHRVQVTNSKGTAETNEFHINVVYVDIPV